MKTFLERLQERADEGQIDPRFLRQRYAHLGEIVVRELGEELPMNPKEYEAFFSQIHDMIKTAKKLQTRK